MLRLHRAERLPAAHQERPAAPEDHRRREDQLRPAGGPLADPGPDGQAEHRPHGDDEERHGQRRADREAAAEVDELGVRAFLAASAPPSAPAPCRRSGSRRGRPARSRGASGRCRWCPPASARARASREVAPGVRLELLLAAAGAEVEAPALVLRHVPGGGAVDLHAADGIGRLDVLVGRRREPGPAALGAEMIGAAGVLVPWLAGGWVDDHAADRVAGLRRQLRCVHVSLPIRT